MLSLRTDRTSAASNIPSRMLYTYRALRLLIGLVLLASMPQAFATTVGCEVIQCPACTKSYVSTVVRSWNTWMTPDGPPPPEDTCPYCLFSWRTKLPTHLTEFEKAQIRKAITGAFTSLRSSVRSELIQALRSGKYTRLDEYLTDACEVASGRKDNRRLRSQNLVPDIDDADERMIERELIALLPEKIRAKKEGRPEPRPQAISGRSYNLISTNERLIRRRHVPAVEYFLLWARDADEKRLNEYDYVIPGSLQALALLPSDMWPSVDMQRVRVREIGDSLQYIHLKTLPPKSLTKAITARRWSIRSNVALAACTARQDRSVAHLLAKRLARERDFVPADAVEVYYKMVGVPADIPVLERYAQNLYPDSGKDADDTLGFTRKDIESAIRTIRMRELLMDPPAPDKSSP